MRTRIKAFWNRWKQNAKENVVIAVLLTFLLLPFAVAARDKALKWLLETPDNAFSVYVCAPLGKVEAWIEDSQGKKHSIPNAKFPNPFDVVIQNSGAKHIDDNEFLILFRSETSDMEIQNISIGSRSPLDKSSYTASVEGNIIRVSSKRMNPGDFVYAGGIADAPINIEVFSRSTGLSTSNSRAPGCGFWKPSIDKVYVFFESHPKKNADK
jgi:hypothetical protein